jgi:hypothetical protein
MDGKGRSDGILVMMEGKNKYVRGRMIRGTPLWLKAKGLRLKAKKTRNNTLRGLHLMPFASGLF